MPLVLNGELSNIMDNNIQKFLDSIKDITYYDINNKNDFNIFKILSLEHRETYFCRFLGELLDPAGTHGADCLLCCFFNTFLE